MQVGVDPVEVTYLSLYFPFLSLFITITKLHLQYNEELTTAPTEPFKNNLTQKVNFYSVGKAIPVPAWTGPEGSSKLRLPVIKTDDTKRWQSCQPYAPAAFSLQKITLVLSRPQGHSVTERLCECHHRDSKLRPPGK
jgi:hypothetical protein